MGRSDPFPDLSPAEVAEHLLTLSPAKMRRALARLDADRLVDVLAATADVIEVAQQREAAGYDLRLAIYQSGRDRTPRVTQGRMATAARVSEPAVIQALRKAASA